MESFVSCIIITLWFFLKLISIRALSPARTSTRIVRRNRSVFNLVTRNNNVHYMDDQDDPFKDELDELFQYMNALQDEDQEIDTNTSKLNLAGDNDNVLYFDFDLSGLDDLTEDTFSLRKENIHSNQNDPEIEQEESLIVPDLSTLLSSVQLAPAS